MVGYSRLSKYQWWIPALISSAAINAAAVVAAISAATNAAAVSAAINAAAAASAAINAVNERL